MMANDPTIAARDAELRRLEAKRIAVKKSLESVEALLERNITEDQLRDRCKNLWQQSYQDCTEERALVELCGYPLCDNPVASQDKKMPKYKICMRTKKVFSTEHQRVFCSSRCLELSEKLKSQLSELPLYMTEIPCGRGVSLNHNEETFDGNLLPQRHQISVDEIEDLTQNVETVSLEDSGLETRGTSKIEIIVTDPLLPVASAPDVFTVEKLETLLSEWFTIATLHYIVGQDRFLQLRAQYDSGFTTPDPDIDYKMAKYARLCAFLDEQERLEGITYSDEEDDMAENHTKAEKKKASSVERQKNRKRKVTFESNGNSIEPEDDSTEDLVIQGSPEPVLPPVDKHQQFLIREKLLLEKMSLLVGTASCLMHIPNHILVRNMSQLIHTFNLTRENCLIRHGEVVVVFAVMMMLLDRKAGGEGQVSKDLRLALDEPLRKAGLGWGDICVALRKATDPGRLFNVR